LLAAEVPLRLSPAATSPPRIMNVPAFGIRRPFAPKIP
jgi:hypothetical protein